MATEHTRIDITQVTDFAQLAEEVRREGRPRMVTRNNEDFVEVKPARARARSRSKTPTAADPVAAREAVLTDTFGAWKDLVDADELKRELNEAQSDDRPAPRL
jgi:hypothetical protein